MPTLKHTSPHQQYRLTVYNQNVRELVKMNLHHEEYEDFWADGRDYLIDAEDEATAVSILRNSMSHEDGFVIADVKPVPPFYYKR